MKETDFSKKFADYLQAKFPFAWGAKIHIDEMQSSSIPDYLFCVNGRFLAIEFKVQRDGRISISPGQIRELNKIRDAHGCALIVAYDENTNKLLLRTKRLDYKAIFFNPVNTKNIKSKNIKIEWDFGFVRYEELTDIIGILLEE